MTHVTFCLSHVTCYMWNAYVDPLDMLNNFCFHVYAQKWVFVIMSHVACHMSHVTCHMSYVKCLCWSLGHAEQFLFSCLCSNVAVYGWKRQCFYLTDFLTQFFRGHQAGLESPKNKPSRLGLACITKKGFLAWLGLACKFKKRALAWFWLGISSGNSSWLYLMTFQPWHQNQTFSESLKLIVKGY